MIEETLETTLIRRTRYELLKVKGKYLVRRIRGINIVILLTTCDNKKAFEFYKQTVEAA